MFCEKFCSPNVQFSKFLLACLFWQLLVVQEIVSNTTSWYRLSISPNWLSLPYYLSPLTWLGVKHGFSRNFQKDYCFSVICRDYKNQHNTFIYTLWRLEGSSHGLLSLHVISNKSLTVLVYSSLTFIKKKQILLLVTILERIREFMLCKTLYLNSVLSSFMHFFYGIKKSSEHIKNIVCQRICICYCQRAKMFN